MTTPNNNFETTAFEATPNQAVQPAATAAPVTIPAAEGAGTGTAVKEKPKANIFLRILQMRVMNARSLQDFGLFLLRVASLPLMLHGWHKLMGFDGFVNGALANNPVGASAPLLIGILVVAGQLLLPVALFFGLFSRICGLLLAVMFVGIIVVFNIPAGVFAEHGGLSFEASILYLVIGLVVFFAGPGRFSLDGATGDRIRFKA